MGVQDLFPTQYESPPVRIYVSQHVSVLEADDTISIFTRLRASPFIVGDVVRVLSTVHLYYQAALMTAEIRNEALDGVGAVEAIAKVATAQVIP
jgi:predicted extracellular nuclease